MLCIQYVLLMSIILYSYLALKTNKHERDERSKYIFAKCLECSTSPCGSGLARCSLIQLYLRDLHGKLCMVKFWKAQGHFLFIYTWSHIGCQAIGYLADPSVLAVVY